uniref:Large ribosomal subunit protein P2 n=1 Tax=Oryzias latipes TaxID=8090 RepID=A0A3B3HUX8_ORYLA
MRYVAAYLLAALGGNTSPSAKDIKDILGSVGIEADDERLNKVIGELNGKNINEVVNSGKGCPPPVHLCKCFPVCLQRCFAGSFWFPCELMLGMHIAFISTFTTCHHTQH